MTELIVLGSAQDGGLPHAGCRCIQCERARRDPAFRRLPAAIGIIDGNDAVLIDATSAFGEQIHALRLAAMPRDTGERYRPPATVLLTHAHTGHYIGLWQLDRSVLAADAVRVVGPPATIGLLKANEPWQTMARDGFITFEALQPDEPLHVTPNATVTPIPVPHRSEWATDTVAYRVEGPSQAALYLPDIDAWDNWERTLEAEVGRVNVALLDGTFWEPFPIPGVPHPPVRETVERLQAIVNRDRARIVFTHLNHSNPLVDPDSLESREVRQRGFAVAREGDRITL